MIAAMFDEDRQFTGSFIFQMKGEAKYSSGVVGNLQFDCLREVPYAGCFVFPARKGPDMIFRPGLPFGRKVFNRKKAWSLFDFRNTPEMCDRQSLGLVMFKRGI